MNQQPYFVLPNVSDANHAPLVLHSPPMPPFSPVQGSSPPLLIPNVLYPVYNMSPTHGTSPISHVTTHHSLPVIPTSPSSTSFQPAQEGLPLPHIHSVPSVPENLQGPTFVLTMDEIQEESKKLRQRGSQMKNGTMYYSRPNTDETESNNEEHNRPHYTRGVERFRSDSQPNAIMFQNVVVNRPTQL
jgi:hypothetical protein